MKTFKYESDFQVLGNEHRAFIVSSLAAARGLCRIHHFPKDQKPAKEQTPFIKLFQKMKIPLRFENSDLVVERASEICPLEADLTQAPDLIPVLGVLLSKAQGKSCLRLGPDFPQKRLELLSILFGHMRVSHRLLSSSLEMEGVPFHHHQFFVFDPEQDPEMAFAAAVARSMGYRLRVLNSQVTEQAFPGFWNLISGGPG